MHTPPNGSASVFTYEGIPPMGQLIPLGLQHVVAAVVGVITPAIIISGSEVCGLSAAVRDREKALSIPGAPRRNFMETKNSIFPRRKEGPVMSGIPRPIPFGGPPAH